METARRRRMYDDVLSALDQLMVLYRLSIVFGRVDHLTAAERGFDLALSFNRCFLWEKSLVFVVFFHGVLVTIILELGYGVMVLFARFLVQVKVCRAVAVRCRWAALGEVLEGRKA